MKFFHGNEVNVKRVIEEIALEGQEKDTVSPLVLLKEIFEESYLRKALALSCCALQVRFSLHLFPLSSILSCGAMGCSAPVNETWRVRSPNTKQTSNIFVFFSNTAQFQLTVADWSLLLLSTYFLEKVNLSTSLAAWSSTGMTLAFMIGTFTGSLFVERWIYPKNRKSAVLESVAVLCCSFSLF